MKNHIIIPIKKNEIREAAKTLHQAFQNDPLMQWIFGSDELYEQKGLTIIETWVKYAVLYGIAYRTENFEAVAIRKKPNDIKTSFWRLFRSGMLKTPIILRNDAAFKRLMAFDELSTKTKLEVMHNKPFLYCWLIGTMPQFQKKGFGAALMKQTFAAAHGQTCYLEVASSTSKGVHTARGYIKQKEFTLPNSNVVISVMIRPC